MADWTRCIEVPENLSDEASAGVFITYPTSYAALVQRAQLQEGEWCLVHAGAGGVGLAAVQIAKAVGAKVIATASTEDKLAVIRREGGLDDGDHTLLYNTDEWIDQVKKITGKGLVQVVYDPVGLLNVRSPLETSSNGGLCLPRTEIAQGRRMELPTARRRVRSGTDRYVALTLSFGKY